MNIPQHVAIILDGKWALGQVKRECPCNYGYACRGRNVMERICEDAYRME